MRGLRALRRGLLPLLAVALLVMQAAGLWHRIEHGATSAWSGAHDAALEAGHHCAAIDSHTLASASPAWVVSWCPDSDSPRPTVPPAALSVIAARAWPFHARAPPSRPC